MSDLLTVRNLAVDFALEGGSVQAVRGASFRVPYGKTVALVGESGSGKSVCAQAIMGLLPKSARIKGGEILFDRAAGGGNDWNQKGGIVDIAQLHRDGPEMRAIRGAAISIIFQEPMTSLSPVHTVGHQITEALHLHSKLSDAEGHERALAMLRAVGFPDPERALKTYPFELSGGLRQRAMIAMALVCKPALLIADEPTTALDVTIQAQILKLMADLQAELGMAMLMITHDLGVVANIADEVVVMYQGEVMEAGSVEDIFRAPEHPYLKALLNAVPRFGMRDDERLVPIREIKSEAGPLFAEKQPWPASADEVGPLLSVGNVSKGFTIRKGGFFSMQPAKSVTAVSDVSFDVMRGECLGLVGESGCGKTTLSKIIMKAINADTGDIRFNDRGRLIDVRHMKGADLGEYRKRVQFVFQDPIGSLNPRMTVFDIISEPLIIHNVGTPETRTEMVKELMALVGLDIRHLRRYPHSFSGGQRQRIGIARALALRPDLIICDEPVSALDVSIQAQILNLLKDLKAKLGLTYIFISHNLAVVDYVADRIMVMCAGRVVELAPTRELFRNPVHPYTKALLAAVPNPSLEAPLDFNRVMEGKTSVPSLWPAPFTIDADNQPTLVDIGNDHWVRAALSIRSIAA
ncbi:dipeptide ABC transporter ATP-binding protein [Dongia sp.]|uniref:ABC transporter ATP-binding protein n=1 Tax=Dongia sp. TaxID=1977262 RepID=UPI0035B04018